MAPREEHPRHVDEVVHGAVEVGGDEEAEAVGGGVGMISACDFAFAYQDAAIKLSEIAIGIGPFVTARDR